MPEPPQPERPDRRRVAIIGAGPSGLSLLHAFEAARRAGTAVPDLVCFEKQATWGGLWNYTWRAGLDDVGEPVHGRMYLDLWSNGPKESIEFPDYPFDAHLGRPAPSYLPRAVIRDYLDARAPRTERYDHLVVATGHFSVPNAPDWPGFYTFPGRILHAHDLRDVAEFRGPPRPTSRAPSGGGCAEVRRSSAVSDQSATRASRIAAQADGLGGSA